MTRENDIEALKYTIREQDKLLAVKKININELKNSYSKIEPSLESKEKNSNLLKIATYTPEAKLHRKSRSGYNAHTTQSPSSIFPTENRLMHIIIESPALNDSYDMKYEELINAFRAGETLDLKSPFTQKTQYADFEQNKKSHSCDKNISQFVENGFEYDKKDAFSQIPQKLRGINNNTYENKDENANRPDKEDKSNDYYILQDNHNSILHIEDDKNSKFKATGSFSASQFLNDELKEIINTESDISGLMMSNNDTELNSKDLSLHFKRIEGNNMNTSMNQSVINTPLLSAIERTDMSHRNNGFNQITNTYNTFGDILNTDTDKRVDITPSLSKSQLSDHERNKLGLKSPYNKSFNLEPESPLYKAREDEMKTLCGFELSLNNSRDIHKNNQGKENVFTYHNNNKHISFDAFKEQTIQRKLTQSPISPSPFEKDKEVIFRPLFFFFKYLFFFRMKS